MFGTSSSSFLMYSHIRLGPVGERKHAHVFARIQSGIIEIPNFRPLILRIPLAERIAETKNRSFARAFSSSRRAPPMQQSN